MKELHSAASQGPAALIASISRTVDVTSFLALLTDPLFAAGGLLGEIDFLSPGAVSIAAFRETCRRAMRAGMSFPFLSVLQDCLRSYALSATRTPWRGAAESAPDLIGVQPLSRSEQHYLARLLMLPRADRMHFYVEARR